MSSEELVRAYVDGGVSRRTFIRRLVGGGVSLSAAISYAYLLSPQRAGAAAGSGGDGRDHYEPEIGVDIVTTRLRRALKIGNLEVHITSNDATTFTLEVQIKANRKLKTIGTQTASFSAATDSVLNVPLTRAGRRILAARRHSWIQVVATA